MNCMWTLPFKGLYYLFPVLIKQIDEIQTETKVSFPKPSCHPQYYLLIKLGLN